MPRKRNTSTIEQAAYAAVGAADAATDVVKEKVVDLKAATKKARRRTSSAITDAEKRGRSSVGPSIGIPLVAHSGPILCCVGINC